MDSRLQAYLDGELTLAELPADLRREAEAWGELLVAMAATAPVGAPTGLAARVQSAVRAEVRRRPAWLEWLLRPRPIAASPLAMATAAALVLLAVALPWTLGGPADGGPATVRGVYVQFVVDAPSAETVHLVGDFNDWQPTLSLSDPDGDGIWSGRVFLDPGVHEYMFVLDGSNWITDPNAPSYQDDGFGQRNAVIAVAPLNGT